MKYECSIWIKIKDIVRFTDSLKRYVIALSLCLLIAMPQEYALAGVSGFRVRTASGAILPGTCSFTMKSMSSKASSIVSSIQSKSGSGKTLSYFSSGIRNSAKSLLRSGTPDSAIKYRAHTFFAVKGYKSSIGTVIMRIDSGVTIKSTYKYVAMTAVISSGGSVSWYALRATASDGQFKVSLSSNLCTTLTKSGYTCLIVVVGENSVWW
ncbi:MAG: hypothetical protein LBD16_00805 [Oscillospiraceae bacterium]|jgi:hypothetical protein|nr:hypothetical protein [Oscillospiraceae bacterium]